MSFLTAASSQSPGSFGQPSRGGAASAVSRNLLCVRVAAAPRTAHARAVESSNEFEQVTATATQLAAELEDLSSGRIIGKALDVFGDDVAVSFSGAEDVLLIEYAHQHLQASGGRVRVFSLDTGRLHAETYRLFEAVEKHYNLRIEYCFPEAEQVQQLVRNKGMFSFLVDGHKECCAIRKVAPLRRQLSGLRAWITGQRRDQSPGTRASVPLVEVDGAFTHADGKPLIKFNPLANVSSAEVWAAIRAFGVPYNALHERGYVSIGCEPCTRAILPGQHEREGRWWWEQATAKECGLHVGKDS